MPYWPDLDLVSCDVYVIKGILCHYRTLRVMTWKLMISNLLNSKNIKVLWPSCSSKGKTDLNLVFSGTIRFCLIGDVLSISPGSTFLIIAGVVLLNFSWAQSNEVIAMFYVQVSSIFFLFLVSSEMLLIELRGQMIRNTKGYWITDPDYQLFSGCLLYAMQSRPNVNTGKDTSHRVDNI